jgi:hypothetical protein
LASTSPLGGGAHSYDPGTANGLLWTVPVPEDSIEVHLGAGDALLHLSDFPILDAFTVPNSINPAHPAGRVPAVIDSLSVHWSGILSTIQFASTDPNDKFQGYFLENSATIEVTVTTPASDSLHGFQFVSDPASTTTSHFAQIGQEQNGLFFG